MTHLEVSGVIDVGNGFNKNLNIFILFLSFYR